MPLYKVNLSPQWNGHPHDEEFESSDAHCEVAVTQGYLIPLDERSEPKPSDVSEPAAIHDEHEHDE